MPICPICTHPTIPPTGYKEASILIINDVPDESEYPTEKKSIRFKRPKLTALDILRQELFLLGVDFVRTRRINMWQHKPNKSEKCFEVGLKNVLEEAKGRKAILLVGAESVKYFSGYKVSTVNGLQVESTMLSAPIIYACINPGTVFGKGVGELRFCLKNFVNELIKEGVL